MQEDSYNTLFLVILAIYGQSTKENGLTCRNIVDALLDDCKCFHIQPCWLYWNLFIIWIKFIIQAGHMICFFVTTTPLGLVLIKSKRYSPFNIYILKSFVPLFYTSVPLFSKTFPVKSFVCSLNSYSYLHRHSLDLPT